MGPMSLASIMADSSSTGRAQTEFPAPAPSQLRVRLFPDPVLRRPAAQLATGPQDLPPVREIAERMLELMRSLNGIGLAAPQVGLSWRMFVVDVPPPAQGDEDEEPGPEGAHCWTDGPEVYINPVLRNPEPRLEASDEGCLSLPGISGGVRRPGTITIEATDLAGERFVKKGGGLLARCWQHEFDHLEAVLIIDKMEEADRAKCRGAIRSLERRSKKS